MRLDDVKKDMMTKNQLSWSSGEKKRMISLSIAIQMYGGINKTGNCMMPKLLSFLAGLHCFVNSPGPESAVASAARRLSYGTHVYMYVNIFIYLQYIFCSIMYNTLR